jgi:transposase
LIATAKLNDVDPQAWLADGIHELLPWNWHRQNIAAEAA